VRSLVRHNLIDQFVLLIHPLILGAGQRMFDNDGTPARFKLAESVPTTTGVIIATYELA
jgi:dihydrofolate reductase